jgi:FMN phosphatase YigB (HAD superfamily)
MKSIIWDLSGTLFRTTIRPIPHNERASFSLMLYLWGGKKRASAYDQRALAVLNSLGVQQGPQETIVRLPDDTPVPLLICTWLAGKITNNEATLLALEALEHTTAVAPHEMPLFRELLTRAFDPFALARCTHPLRSACELLKIFAQRTQIHQLALSNWDTESFNILSISEQAHEVFSLIPRERITISADAGFVKPQPQIYEYFLSHYNLDPAHCLFIDNQDENIAVAQKQGIAGVLFEDSFEEMYKQLEPYFHS